MLYKCFFYNYFVVHLYSLIFGFQKVIRKEKNIKKNNFLFFIFYYTIKIFILCLVLGKYQGRKKMLKKMIFS